MNGVKGKKNSSSLSEKKKDKEEGNLFDPQVKTKRLQEITNGELKHLSTLLAAINPPYDGVVAFINNHLNPLPNPSKISVSLSKINILLTSTITDKLNHSNIGIHPKEAPLHFCLAILKAMNEHCTFEFDVKSTPYSDIAQLPKQIAQFLFSVGSYAKAVRLEDVDFQSQYFHLCSLYIKLVEQILSKYNVLAPSAPSKHQNDSSDDSDDEVPAKQPETAESVRNETFTTLISLIGTFSSLNNDAELLPWEENRLALFEFLYFLGEAKVKQKTKIVEMLYRRAVNSFPPLINAEVLLKVLIVAKSAHDLFQSLQEPQLILASKSILQNQNFPVNFMKWCQKENYVNIKEQTKFLSVLFNLGVAKLRGILLDLLKAQENRGEENLFITDSTGSKHMKDVLNEEDEVVDDESMKKLADLLGELEEKVGDSDDVEIPQGPLKNHQQVLVEEENETHLEEREDRYWDSKNSVSSPSKREAKRVQSLDELLSNFPVKNLVPVPFKKTFGARDPRVVNKFKPLFASAPFSNSEQKKDENKPESDAQERKPENKRKRKRNKKSKDKEAQPIVAPSTGTEAPKSEKVAPKAEGNTTPEHSEKRKRKKSKVKDTNASPSTAKPVPSSQENSKKRKPEETKANANTPVISSTSTIEIEVSKKDETSKEAKKKKVEISQEKKEKESSIPVLAAASKMETPAVITQEVRTPITPEFKGTTLGTSSPSTPKDSASKKKRQKKLEKTLANSKTISVLSSQESSSDKKAEEKVSKVSEKSPEVPENEIPKQPESDVPKDDRTTPSEISKNVPKPSEESATEGDAPKANQSTDEASVSEVKSKSPTKSLKKLASPRRTAEEKKDSQTPAPAEEPMKPEKVSELTGSGEKSEQEKIAASPTKETLPEVTSSVSSSPKVSKSKGKKTPTRISYEEESEEVKSKKERPKKKAVARRSIPVEESEEESGSEENEKQEKELSKQEKKEEEESKVFKTPTRGKQRKKEPTPRSVPKGYRKSTDSPIESSSEALRSSNENSETNTPPASQETPASQTRGRRKKVLEPETPTRRSTRLAAKKQAQESNQ